MIEQMSGGASVRETPEKIRQLIDGLLRGLPWLVYPLANLQISRGRIDKRERLLNISEFGCAPADNVKLGRCNYAGVPVFYAAFNLSTIFSELRAEPGDLLHVGIAKVRPANELFLTAIGEIDYVRRFGRPLVGDTETLKSINSLLDAGGDIALRSMFVDAYFAEMFAKDSQSGGVYKPTAALAAHLFEAKSGVVELEGFFYPSVAHRGGTNVVLSETAASAKLEWTKFEVHRVVHKFGFGIFGSDIVASTTKFGDDGAIDW
ncbi:MAG: RES domain-containing protein [Pseudolabrys sp.]|nr:RES domain-containing protein [Pseudolabrys sp.]